MTESSRGSIYEPLKDVSSEWLEGLVFQKSLFGYNKNEVDSTIRKIIDSIVPLIEERDDLNNKIVQLSNERKLLIAQENLTSEEATTLIQKGNLVVEEIESDSFSEIKNLSNYSEEREKAELRKALAGAYEEIESLKRDMVKKDGGFSAVNILEQGKREIQKAIQEKENLEKEIISLKNTCKEMEAEVKNLHKIIENSREPESTEARNLKMVIKTLQEENERLKRSEKSARSQIEVMVRSLQKNK